MSAFDDWKAKQKEIYDGFKAKQQLALKEGLKPDPALTERKGGYLIALRPAGPVQWWAWRQLYEYPPRIASSLVSYKSEHFHTTLSDYGIKTGFEFESDYNPTVMEKLIEAASKAAARVTLPVYCAYGDIVFNQNAIILKGEPVHGRFLDLALNLVDEGKKLGLELRLPWGAHITLARVSKALNPEHVSKIPTRTLAGAVHRYPELLVGYMTPTPTSFKAHFLQSFSLPA